MILSDLSIRISEMILKEQKKDLKKFVGKIVERDDNIYKVIRISGGVVEVKNELDKKMMFPIDDFFGRMVTVVE